MRNKTRCYGPTSHKREGRREEREGGEGGREGGRSLLTMNKRLKIGKYNERQERAGVSVSEKEGERKRVRKSERAQARARARVRGVY